MTDSEPSHLKLHAGLSCDAPTLQADEPLLAEMCQSFRAATAWRLSFVPAPDDVQLDPLRSAPVNPGDGVSPGSLTIEAEPRGERRPCDRSAAHRLAQSLAALLGELTAARQSIWRREAELATGVPVTIRADEPAHLATRLQAVLKGGAVAIDADAAGLYLLDAATTELKLRSAWGLPATRLLDPARPLRGAIADLEAMAGHAVVLEDDSLFPYWKVPEPCAAALCVPVSSSTNILGTLWMFSQQPRDFSEKATNLIEIIAGRVAAELEREVLINEAGNSLFE